MTKPLIGISTSYTKQKNGLNNVRLNQAYVDAVSQAGGIPLLIPSSIAEADLPALVDSLDGLLLSGGGDISLKYFEGVDHPSISGLDAKRDQAELVLTRLFLAKNKPVFGICRGVQALNVAMGGTLNTDIPSQVKTEITHNNPAPDSVPTRNAIVHDVAVEPSSRLARITGKTSLQVNSFHHQGVNKAAPGANITSHAPDGTIESIEFPQYHFCLGVQWHPEWLTYQPETQALFKAFVDSARKAA